MADAYVTTYTTKLTGRLERESGSNLEFVIDCTEIIGASGKVPEADLLVPSVTAAATAATADPAEILHPARHQRTAA